MYGPDCVDNVVAELVSGRSAGLRSFVWDPSSVDGDTDLLYRLLEPCLIKGWLECTQLQEFISTKESRDIKGGAVQR